VAEDKHEKSAAGEATDALKTLLARIGEIFGVFDLSFFVAGAVCAGALVFGLHVSGAMSLAGVDLTEWTAVHVGIAVLGCYVLGIVCFAAGRLRRSDQSFYLELPQQLRDFGLGKQYGLEDIVPPAPSPSLMARVRAWFGVAPATDRDRLASKCARVYTRLWAEVRQDSTLAPSFNLVMRYWVMAAMCDGLAAALGVWVMVWGAFTAHVAPASRPAVAVVELGLMFATWLCFREAGRYTRYQCYEIVATLAYRHDALRRDAGAAGAKRER
jgi:hypothetical protein